jgi:hypothetical protein
MSKQQFKHNAGDLVETKSGRCGKVVEARIVYHISFGPEVSDHEDIDEVNIVTPEKLKRTRKKKEKVESVA